MFYARDVLLAAALLNIWFAKADTARATVCHLEVIILSFD